MQKWSPWKDYDPNMKSEIKGKDGSVGATHSRTGNEKVGTGYQEITSIEPNEKIELDLVFQEPWESKSQVYYTFQEQGNSTGVTWGYKEKTPIPQNLIMRTMGVKKMLQKDFDKGLEKLKKIRNL